MKNFGKWKKWSKTFLSFLILFCTFAPDESKSLVARAIYAVEQLFEKLMKIVSEKFGSVDKFLYICSMLNYKM